VEKVGDLSNNSWAIGSKKRIDQLDRSASKNLKKRSKDGCSIGNNRLVEKDAEENAPDWCKRNSDLEKKRVRGVKWEKFDRRLTVGTLML
jgi:hypothetical protein